MQVWTERHVKPDRAGILRDKSPEETGRGADARLFVIVGRSFMSLFATHRGAVVLALFVTFLWSTSWIIIKVGLDELPPLTFAGLRYSLGFLCLIPYAFRYRRTRFNAPMHVRDWLTLAGFGILFYAITQGAQFAALVHLPATGLSLLLNLSPLLIAVLGYALLGESLRWQHVVGLVLCLTGVLLYFGVDALEHGSRFGILLGMVCLLSNSLSAIAGRVINRHGRYPPALVTLVSMGVGSLTLLALGLSVEPWPGLNTQQVLLIGWLAIFNTAIAFVLWNTALRQLTATESGLINNAMLPQITLLSWVFLGEHVGLREIVAVSLVMMAVLSLYKLKSR